MAAHPEFPAEGVWLRCQLHAHTTESDGEATIEGLIGHYVRGGYDVLAITDHWLLTRAAERAGLILLTGSELSALPPDEGFVIDVLAYGIEVLPEPRAHFPSVAAAADWVVEQGGVAYLPHPYWNGLEARHYADASALSGIEVMNAGCEVTQGSGLSDEIWDAILGRGLPCLALATDDCHEPGDDSRLAWTMVRVAERTPAAVLAALRDGAFYGSTGPAIHAVERVPGGLRVRCSPARAVTLRSGRYDGCRANAGPTEVCRRSRVLERSESGLITVVELDAPEHCDWGRVEVLAADGTKAWANPTSFAPG